MGVDIALDVGGPACRVLYQPQRGDFIQPNRQHHVSLYSRTARSATGTQWERKLGEQPRPVMRDLNDDRRPAVYLPTHVALPRHVPLISSPPSNDKEIKYMTLFSNADGDKIIPFRHEGKFAFVLSRSICQSSDSLDRSPLLLQVDASSSQARCCVRRFGQA